MGSNCSSNRSQEIKKTIEVPGLKIAVIGDPEVGKSCVLDRYIHNQFSPLYIPTRKVDLRNAVRKLNIPGHATVPITFWDIPGREDLDIHESYFRNLDAVIVVVDASDPLCVNIGSQWRQCVLNNASFTHSHGHSDRDSNGGRVEKEGKQKGDHANGTDPNLNNTADNGQHDNGNVGVGVEDTQNHDEIQTQQPVPSVEEVKGGEGSNVNVDRKLKLAENIPFLLLGNKKDLITKANASNEDVITVQPIQDSTNTKLSDNLEATIQRMEEAVSLGFIGSVLVSAKSNDMSVSGAVQSFLRRVLESRYVERRWKAVDKEVKVKRQRYEFKPQLEPVGIEEIDAEFCDADKVIHRVEALSRYQDDALVKFAGQCLDIGVIDSIQNAGMQNCLVALRNKLVDVDLKLKLVLVEDFYTLEVKATEQDKELELQLRYTLKTFNKEYVAVTATMLKEFPLAIKTLGRIDRSVDNHCQLFNIPVPVSVVSNQANFDGSPNSSVSVNTMTSTDLHRKASVVERNRAKLRHTIHRCEESLSAIQTSVKQVKAAFVW